MSGCMSIFLPLYLYAVVLLLWCFVYSYHSGVWFGCVVSLQQSAPVAYESVCVFYSRSTYSGAQNELRSCCWLNDVFVLFALWQRSFFGCRSHEVWWGDENEVTRWEWDTYCGCVCASVRAYVYEQKTPTHVNYKATGSQVFRAYTTHTYKRTYTQTQLSRSHSQWLC